MDFFQAIIYGIVQGLGEFLPISSTAHITLLPWLFGWQDPGLTFDVALHMGTLLAVLAFFWRDWIRLVKAGFTDLKSNEGKLFWFIMFACIPGGIVGVLLNDRVETSFRNPALIGLMLIIMGIVLYVADKTSRADVKIDNIGFKRSFLIGVSQALAIIPGVSRSGITMAAGRWFKLTREDAARFTFLLSTPFIFLSGLYKASDLKNVNVDTMPFIAAIATSAVVGAISIKFLLGYLKKNGFGIFVVYRLVLGLAVIVIWLFR
jgi:undecaprenyl-diphosphatase